MEDDMRAQVADFLDKHNLNPDGIGMDGLCDYFIREMEMGLSGQKSSLPMIPSYCSPNALPRAGETVIVIDAGGTNLRTCLVEFDPSLKPVVHDFKRTRMPGFDREVSAKEFFEVFAGEIERLVDKSDRIAFCFSYAARILPDHDGVPIGFSKEIKATEVIGMRLGENLLAELARRGHDVSKKKVIILNDTVTTLLAAQSHNTDGKYDGCIGFILGTGTNTAYIEQNCRIQKLPEGHCMQGSQIINVESGCLDICLGDIDREFLDGTVDPKSYNFEKMISGAYLGPLGRHVISAAVKENLFSEGFSSRFDELCSCTGSLETKDLSCFLEHEDSPSDYPCDNDAQCYDCGSMDDNVLVRCVAGNEEDADTLCELLTAFISRAAKLTAVNLASAVLMTNFGKDPDHPVLINADGTTFYKTAYLRSFTQEYLDAFLAQKGRRAVFTRIEDSPIIGCAIGGLTL